MRQLLVGYAIWFGVLAFCAACWALVAFGVMAAL
jgi:hypothetical protein